MKAVKCANKECGNVIQWQTGKKRKHRTIEVDDNYEGKVYCSITCACMDGELNINEVDKDLYLSKNF